MQEYAAQKVVEEIGVYAALEWGKAALKLQIKKS